MTAAPGFWKTPIAARLYIAVVRAGGMQAVASLSGIRERVLYDWLTTYQKPSLSKVQQLATACNVDMAWLANGNGSLIDEAEETVGREVTEDQRLFSERLSASIQIGGGHGAVAARANITGRSLISYLTAETEPPRPQLLALARACGVNLLWLASGEGPVVPELPQ